jgi:hypothetical protein
MIFNFVLLPVAIVAIGIFIIWLSIRRMRSPSVRTISTWRRMIERVVLSVVVVAALVVVGSVSYNAIAINSFWARNPAPGTTVDVGGHRMHINCTGSGSPVLVLEAGGRMTPRYGEVFNLRFRRQLRFAPTIELVRAGAIRSRARAMLITLPPSYTSS